jgi:hypothetical protein
VNRRDPLTLMRQDLRQIMLTNQIRTVVKQVLEEIGLLDLLKKFSIEPPEPPKGPTLHLVK